MDSVQGFSLQPTIGGVVAVVCRMCEKTVGWTSHLKIVKLIEAAHLLKVHGTK